MSQAFGQAEAIKFVATITKFDEITKVGWGNPEDIPPGYRSLLQSSIETCLSWLTDVDIQNARAAGYRIGVLVYQTICDTVASKTRFYVRYFFVSCMNRENLPAHARELYTGVLQGFEDTSKASNGMTNHGYATYNFHPSTFESYVQGLVSQYMNRKGSGDAASDEVLRTNRQIEMKWQGSAAGEPDGEAAGRHFGKTMYTYISAQDSRCREGLIKGYFPQRLIQLQDIDARAPSPAQKDRVRNFYSAALDKFQELARQMEM